MTKQGWKGERQKHSMAARGISTTPESGIHYPKHGIPDRLDIHKLYPHPDYPKVKDFMVETSLTISRFPDKKNALKMIKENMEINKSMCEDRNVKCEVVEIDVDKNRKIVYMNKGD